MNKRVLWTYILLIGLCSFTLVGCGSDQNIDNSARTVVETGHEGHNHGPGEHLDESAPTYRINMTDWCYEHSVPESECTKCNPSLIAGFEESGDWCAGHSLPESHCRRCNPGIVFPQEELLPAAKIEAADNEINVSLNYRTNASACATDGALIQFASPATAEKGGITVQTVRGTKRVTTDEAPAEIIFDETRTSVISISITASVANWLVSPGDKVIKGQVLAILQSPDIAPLRSDLVTSFTRYQIEQKELARHSELKERNLISDADWDIQVAVTEQARVEYLSARGLLLSAGLDESDLVEIIENDNLSNRFTLRAPMDGVILNRIAKMGVLLDAGSAFAQIGDPLAMWIEARLSERQMNEVELGHRLTFSSDGRGINRVGGEIIWVSRFLDQHTRTGIVRARILEPTYSLRAGEFGRVRIVNGEDKNIVLVPKDAVQWEGCCNVVFVRESVDRYRPSKVRLVGGAGPFYQVADGIVPGQEVVVNGAFLLKTELKKSSIGAGCCGLEPVG